MENLCFQGIFKLVHRKVGLKIIALERSYFWHKLLLFFHHYFSLPALAQKYTSYCACFLLFVLPVCVLFPVQDLNLIFSGEALQIPWDGSHIGVADLSGFGCEWLCAYLVQNKSMTGFSVGPDNLSEWRGLFRSLLRMFSVADICTQRAISQIRMSYPFVVIESSTGLPYLQLRFGWQSWLCCLLPIFSCLPGSWHLN